MNDKGLTLIKLVVVIAIIGIIASISASSFNDLIRRQRELHGEVNVLFSLIYLARSEAIN